MRHDLLKDVMKINEIFHSIQGEGKLAGVPSVFIRTTGCNLRCTWCDSPATSWQPVGENRTLDEILDRLGDFACTHVILTGGEPMLAAGVEELTRRVRKGGYHLTLETAGTLWKDVVCDLASISPKLSNSTPWTRDGGRRADAHERERLNLETIRRFMHLADYQLKFVVETQDDLAEVDEIVAFLGEVDPTNVLLMPQGVTPEELNSRGRWIAELCKHRGYRFCPRLHIALFGHAPGT